MSGWDWEWEIIAALNMGIAIVSRFLNTLSPSHTTMKIEVYRHFHFAKKNAIPIYFLLKMNISISTSGLVVE